MDRQAIDALAEAERDAKRWQTEAEEQARQKAEQVVRAHRMGEEIERLREQVTSLQGANTAEVERRRDAQAVAEMLRTARDAMAASLHACTFERDAAKELIARGADDAAMLDWLDKQTGNYTGQVAFRWSTTGRGWRLHEHETGYATVREAITAAMLEERGELEHSDEPAPVPAGLGTPDGVDL